MTPSSCKGASEEAALTRRSYVPPDCRHNERDSNSEKGEPTGRRRRQQSVSISAQEEPAPTRLRHTDLEAGRVRNVTVLRLQLDLHLQTVTLLRYARPCKRLLPLAPKRDKDNQVCPY